MDSKHKEIERLTELSGQAGFWDDAENAQKIGQQLAALRSQVQEWQRAFDKVEDACVLSELADEEEDEATQAELLAEFGAIEKLVAQQELALMLGGEHDRLNALIVIHPGAGGTESQDWAAMLLRMYLRWVETHGYKAETLDYQEGDQAGIKSVTLLVEGPFAFGYLRAEKGIHRLVRLSPFDANNRRHTSFVAVHVTPEIDDSIEIDIKPEDLRVDTYRAGGPGGQHVNRTDSAVRLTHFPTGIVVACQNERSQHKNKATAMKILRSRLYDHYRELQEQERAKISGAKSDIAWGHQIRSYVFHPYRLVKDHRTDVETGNIDNVMDGDLDLFIEAYLKQQGDERA